MLTVKARVKNSLIKNAGVGLFSGEFIGRGEVVWKKDITDIAVLKEEYEILKAEGLTEWIETYGTEEQDGNWFIDADDFKYINHSKENENILFLDYIGVSLRNIDVGEELYCDYEKITTKKHFKQLIK